MKMSVEAQRETLCMNLKGKSITVNRTERVCVNCAWYEQYYHQNRGNIYAWVPTSMGYCLAKECRRGALRQACRQFTPNA